MAKGSLIRMKASRPGESNLSQTAFGWLLLRWVEVLCQIILIVTLVLFFKIAVPPYLIVAIIGFAAGSNVYLYLLRKHHQEIPAWLLGLIMFLDLILLTALLYATGGAMNPFTFLFLVHVTIGAMLMRPAWSWGLTLFSIFCYGLLFYLPELGAEVLGGGHGLAVRGEVVKLLDQHAYLALHLKGMWVAYCVVALFIVFFVGKIKQGLEEHQETIARLKEDKLRNEKLASLATLAAGAAHEFSTPLATIAVAAGEMLYAAETDGYPQDIVEDAKLIRGQVERCREILFHMSADAGEHMGESLETIPVGRLVVDILAELAESCPHPVEHDNRVGELAIRMGYRSLFRSLKGLVKNSIESSRKGTPVRVVSRVEDNFLCFTVIDQGEGMPPEILAKAGEPFFTSKGPGKGLGLGLFLAKSMAERYGGSLAIRSEENVGTTVTIRLPLEKVMP